MNTKSALLRASALAFLLGHTWLQAAVIPIFDNLETPTNTRDVTSEVWWGQSFGVDADYTLTSVMLRMEMAGDPAGNFFVRIYDATGGTDNTPGAIVLDSLGNADLVGILVGNNPSSAGIHEFRPAATLNLSVGTYYVVAGVSSGTGSYVWDFEAPSDIGPPDTSIGIGNSGDSGTSWTRIEGLAFNMQVNAVPEPANMALGIFGVLLVGVQSFRWWNARRRQIDPIASR